MQPTAPQPQSSFQSKNSRMVFTIWMLVVQKLYNVHFCNFSTFKNKCFEKKAGLCFGSLSPILCLERDHDIHKLLIGSFHWESWYLETDRKWGFHIRDYIHIRDGVFFSNWLMNLWSNQDTVPKRYHFVSQTVSFCNLCVFSIDWVCQQELLFPSIKN